MTIRFSRILLIAVVTICAQSAAQAQEDVIPLHNIPAGPGRGTGSISGKVVLPSGQPVGQRARIVLSTMNNPGMIFYTDNAGGFGFGGLREGMYTVEIAADPKLYETETQEVRLIRGMHVKLLITLREKSPAGKKPAGKVVSTAEIDQNVPAAAKSEFEKATALVNEGKLQEAIERLKRAIAIYPGYLMAHNDLGAQYLKLNRPAEAAEHFEAAIEIDSKAFNPRLNLGIALIEQKKYNRAKEHLSQAVSIDSSSPAAHLYLGIASVEMDELEDAERELKTVLSLAAADYSVAHFYLAHVHMKNGDRDRAIDELKTYLGKEPGGKQSDRARQLLEKLKE